MVGQRPGIGDSFDDDKEGVAGEDCDHLRLVCLCLATSDKAGIETNGLSAGSR